jgi:hypothetical protein
MNTGIQQDELNNVDNTIDAYAKWFDSQQMDFNIECRDNKWICSAWFRGKWGGAEGYSSDNFMKAVNSCYVEAKKELVNPIPRKRDWSPS